MDEKQELSLMDKYREWAIGNGYAPQTRFAGRAVPFLRWVIDNIERITRQSKYKELRELYEYYGFPREMAVAVFDYLNSGSTIDWKESEINEYAAFIMEMYVPMVDNIGQGWLAHSSFVIDSIVIHHMPMFIANYPWDSKCHWPTPSQIRLMVDMYRIMNADIEINGERPGGGLWEWILQYGEHSPIPTEIILEAMQDAIESGNPELIAEYITPKFLRTQPLVCPNGDDSALCEVWEYFVTSMETGKSYPDELMAWYGSSSEKAITFEDLYKLIYDDILKLMKEQVEGIKKLGAVGGTYHQNGLMSLYRTIVYNDDEKKFGLTVANDLMI